MKLAVWLCLFVSGVEGDAVWNAATAYPPVPAYVIAFGAAMLAFQVGVTAVLARRWWRGRMR